MATQVLFRRGTTSQNDNFMGGAGELTVNLSNVAVRVHDGITLGGVEMARADLTNVTGNALATPGGSNTNIQYNDDGVLGGSNAFSFNNTTNVVTVTNLIANNVVGNLVPNANATWSLGNSTNRWKDLYISGNTIYMDDAQIKSYQQIVIIKGLSITANGAVDIANAPNPGSMFVSANMTAGNITVNSNLNANIANIANLSGNTANFGNITAGNITVTGNVQLSSIINGNSNVIVNPNTAVTISSNGVANILAINSNGTFATSTFKDDVIVQGNLTVNGTAVYVNVSSESIADPVIDLGVGQNASPIVVSDSFDRGIAMHQLGSGVSRTTTSPVVTGTTFIPLNSVAGITIGMQVGDSNSIYTIPVGTKILAVNASNVQINLPVGANIANGTILNIGTDTIRFMGWDTSNSEFTMSSNVTQVGSVITVNELGNVRADRFVGDGLSVTDLANVFIPGGTGGYTIVTDGLGNLSWAAGSAANGLTSTDLILPIGETANGLPYTSEDNKDRGVSMTSYGGAVTRISSGSTSIGATVIALGGTAGVEVGQQLSITAQPGAFTPGTVVDSIDVLNATVTINNATLELISDNTVITFGTNNLEFMGWDTSAGQFIFGANVSIASNVVTVNDYGNVRAHTFFGNIEGGIANGTSSVTVPDVDGNVAIVAGGNSVLTVTSTSVLIDGDLAATAKIATLGLTSNGYPYATNDNKDRGISMVSYGNAASLTVATTPVAISDTTVTVASVAGAVIGQRVVFATQPTAFPLNTTITAINAPTKTLTLSQAALEIVALATTFTVGSDKQEFMGWDVSVGQFVLGSDVSVTANVVTIGTYGNLRAGKLTASGVNVANVANVYIAGGTSGQVLTTDGAGNLTWATAVAPSALAGTDLILPIGVTATDTPYTANDNKDRGVSMASYGNAASLTIDGEVALGATTLVVVSTTGAIVGQVVVVPTQLTALSAGTTITAINVPTKTVTINNATLEIIPTTTAITVGTNNIEFMGWDESADEFILGSNVTVTANVVTVGTYGNLHTGSITVANAEVTGNLLVDTNAEVMGNLQVDANTLLQGNVTTTGIMTRLGGTITRVESQLFGTTAGTLSMGLGADDQPLTSDTELDVGIISHTYGDVVQKTAAGITPLANTVITINNVTNVTVGQAVYSYEQTGAIAPGSTVTNVDVPNSQITISNALLEALAATTVVTIGSDRLEFMGWDNSNAEFAFGGNVDIVGSNIVFTTMANVRAATFIGTGLTVPNIANVYITGGTNGQVLTTDGLGNLTWATAVAPSALAGTDLILPIGVTSTDTPYTANDNKDRGVSMASYGNAASLTIDGEVALGATTLVVVSTTGAVVGQVVVVPTQLTALSGGTTITVIDVPTKTITISAATLEIIPTTTAITVGTNNIEFMGWDESADEFILGSNVTIAGNVVTVGTYGNLHTGSITVANAEVMGNLLVDTNAEVMGNLQVDTNTLLQGNVKTAGAITRIESSLFGTTVGTIAMGIAATEGPLLSNTGLDVGIVSHTYGGATQKTAAGAAPLANTVITLNAVTNIAVGQTVYSYAQPAAIPFGTTVVSIDVPNLQITISVPLAEELLNATAVTIGSDQLEFMGWDNSNAEFAFGSNVDFSGGTIVFNTLANVRADTFIGSGLNVPNVANIYIEGGTGGQFLQTDGAGNLSWATASSLSNGTSNVVVGANSNVTISSANVANVLVVSGNENRVDYTSTAIVTLGDTVIPVDTVVGLTVGEVLQAPTFLTPGTTITAINALNVTVSAATILAAPLGTTFYTTAPTSVVEVADALTVAGVSSFGDVGNVKILGGIDNQFLQTDGLGNLAWATVDSLQISQISNGNSNVVVAANANVTISSNGVANVMTLSAATNPTNFTSTAIVTLGATVIPLNSVTGLAIGQVLNAPTFLTPGTTITAINALDVTVSAATILEAPLGTTFFTTAPTSLVEITDAFKVAGKANLNSVGNVTITGGSSGQILGTDGLGNLAWVSGASPGALTSQELILPIGNTATDTPYTTNDNKDRGLLMSSYGNGAALTTDGSTTLGATTLVVVSTTGAVVGQSIVVPTQLTALAGGTTITAIDVPTKTLTLSAATLEIIPTATSVTVGSNNKEFIGWDESASEFAFGSNVSVAGNVVTFTELGNVRADTFIGNVQGNLVNGNSSVKVAANGAVLISSNGTANVVTVTNQVATVTANVAITGDLSTTAKIINVATTVTPYTTNDNADRGVSTTSYGGAVALTLDGEVVLGATTLVVVSTTGAVVGQAVTIPTLPAALTGGTTITVIDVPTKTITISSATLALIPTTTSITVGSDNTEFFGWDNSAGRFIFGSNVTIASDVVTVATYGNVQAQTFFGNAAELGNLAVSGNATVATNLTAGNALITGNLTVSGTTTFIKTDNVYFTDPILDLGVTSTLLPIITDDGKDRGLLLSSYGNANVITTSGATSAGNTIVVLTSTTGIIVGQQVTSSTPDIIFPGTTIANVDVANSQVSLSSVTANSIPSGVSLIFGSDRTSFVGWDISASEFIMASNATVSGEVVSVDTYGNIHAGFFIGNGSELVNITSGTEGNITIVGADGKVDASDLYFDDGNTSANIVWSSEQVTEYVTQAILNLPDLPPVTVATTANSTRTGLIAIDGVTLTAGQYVLVKNQTNNDNGVFKAAVGAWVRQAYDSITDAYIDVTTETTYAQLNIDGGIVNVLSGTVNKNLQFQINVQNPSAVFTATPVYVTATTKIPVASPNNRFVMTGSGNDTLNNGSSAFPFATLTRALVGASFPLSVTVGSSGGSDASAITWVSGQQNTVVQAINSMTNSGQTAMTGAQTFATGSTRNNFKGLSFTTGLTVPFTFASGALMRNYLQDITVNTTASTWMSLDAGVSNWITLDNITINNYNPVVLPSFANAFTFYIYNQASLLSFTGAGAANTSVVIINTPDGLVRLPSSYLGAITWADPAWGSRIGSALYPEGVLTSEPELSNVLNWVADSTYDGYYYINFAGPSEFEQGAIIGKQTVGGVTQVWWARNAAQAPSSMTTSTGKTFLKSVGNVTILGGTSGQILSTNGSGTLSWIAPVSGASAWKAKTTALVFDSDATVAALTLPIGAIVDRVTVIVDTAFDDTPTITVGINGGSATAYSVVTDVTLTTASRYDMPNAIAPSLTTTGIEIYYEAAAATVGAARVLITYCIPD